jgi:hypothetical protein
MVESEAFGPIPTEVCETWVKGAAAEEKAKGDEWALIRLQHADREARRNGFRDAAEADAVAADGRRVRATLWVNR